MRILVATDHYPPFIGGAHRWAFLMAQGLVQRGHEVTVITEWHGGMDRVEQDDAWPVYRIRQLRTTPTRRITDSSQRHSPPFDDPVSARDAAKVIDARRPEVCISHGWIGFSLLGALRARRIPVMLSAHDYGYFCPTRVLLHQGEPCSGPAPSKCLPCAGNFYGPSVGTAAVLGLLAGRPRLARGVSAVHTVSSYVDAMTWKFLFGPQGPAHHVRRYIIPPFVETDEVLSAAQAAERDRIITQLPHGPFIMFAGALRTIKGVHVLLDAYRQLPEPRPPLVLMGTRHPDTPTDLPPGAHIIENAPHPVVMAGWARALIAVAPSVWPEPLGTVAVEAARSGTPCIITYPSGMTDVISADAGVLVRQGSVSELRDALALLIADPSLRTRLGDAGRVRADRFGASRVLDEYEQALGDLVADRAAMTHGPGLAVT